MIKMTRTAVFPKLYDPNLEYWNLLFINLEKIQLILWKNNQSNISNDYNCVQRITYYQIIINQIVEPTKINKKLILVNFGN